MNKQIVARAWRRIALTEFCRATALALAAGALVACGGGSGGGSGGGGGSQPPPPTYTIGGTLSGTTGSLTLQDNSSDAELLSKDGPFTFATAIGDGGSYKVTVTTPPQGETCAVTNGEGKVSGANVNSVAVVCHSTRFLLKDAMSTQGDATGKLYHTIFNYDDKVRIARVDRAVSADANHPEQYAVTDSTRFDYDASGHLFSMTPSAAPGFTFQYPTDFVIAILPNGFDAARDSTTTFDFNVHGHSELDAVNVHVPPASTNGSAYSRIDAFAYNDIGGIQSATSTNLTGAVEAQWASFSVDASPPIANPFANGTTIERRLVYYLFKVATAWDMLGPTWSNGVFETYSYASGGKVPHTHVVNAYTLDANGNVATLVQSYADAPAFNTWVKTPAVTFTYEAH
jgi:hypothetical protein